MEPGSPTGAAGTTATRQSDWSRGYDRNPAVRLEPRVRPQPGSSIETSV
ncbi:hypothetical protein [Alicyclobacillus mengziensis]|uniref:Uncharacterized protein n=1 Tax=Alicyclobacillus mengziensis TaxID=2931921 RepID=A0A9X7W0Q6_9BACL|nr:hypothetical protein [Alicyclobacillus mengziensis]QSO48576.1 hypothetical protein JZ786_06225 [Alicyclobacillus mengziensis]